MKKKLVIVDVFYLLAAITGIKTYTVELWNGLNEIDSEQYEFKAVPNFSKTLDIKIFRNKPHLALRLLYHVLYFLWKQLVLPFCAIRYKADVLISPDYISPLWKLRCLKASVVHDSLFWDYPANYNKYWRWYYLRILRWGLRGKSLVITTSHYSKRRLVPHLPSGVPVEVVYQNLSQGLLAEMGAQGNSVLSKLRLVSGKYIFHTGYFDRRKNLPKLVEAFATFRRISLNKDLKLVLAGETGPQDAGSVYSQIIDSAKRMEIADSIILPGYVSTAELKSLYTNALMYVFPSVEEGFGIPILEAMAHDLPVLASRAGALAEIGGDAVLLFDPASEQEIAEAMLSVYNDVGLRSRLIERGRNRLTLFSRQRFAQQALDAIAKH